MSQTKTHLFTPDLTLIELVLTYPIGSTWISASGYTFVVRGHRCDEREYGVLVSHMGRGISHPFPPNVLVTMVTV